MNLIASLVVAWCLLGIGSSELIGGRPVDKNIPPAFVTTLNVKRGEEVNKTCQASIIKRDKGIAYFLTAANCFDDGTETTYTMTYYHTGKYEGSQVEIRVNPKIYVHDNYRRGYKTDNLAVFSTEDQFPRVQPHIITSEATNNEIVEIFAWQQAEKDDSRYLRLHSIETVMIDPKLCDSSYPTSQIKDRHICASGWFRKGLGKEAVGTSLLRRDKTDPGLFWLLGVSTLERNWESLSRRAPIEFLDIKPYKAWIDSLDFN